MALLARRRSAWDHLEGRIRMKRRFRRAALLLLVVGLLAVAVVASSASPALAYGKANWQVAINGTATFPGTGLASGSGVGASSPVESRPATMATASSRSTSTRR